MAFLVTDYICSDSLACMQCGGYSGSASGGADQIPLHRSPSIETRPYIECCLCAPTIALKYTLTVLYYRLGRGRSGIEKLCINLTIIKKNSRVRSMYMQQQHSGFVSIMQRLIGSPTQHGVLSLPPGWMNPSRFSFPSNPSLFGPPCRFLLLFSSSKRKQSKR